MTYLIARLFERTVDIISGPPDTRDVVLVVPETLFEVHAQLGEECGVRCLLVDLSPQCKPGALSQGGKCCLVLLIRAVKACSRIISMRSSTARHQ